MVADRADVETGVAAPLVDLNLVDNRADFGLDAIQPDHRVELGQQARNLGRVAARFARGADAGCCHSLDHRDSGAVGDQYTRLGSVLQLAAIELT
jgi:hypothetical protein